MEIRINRGNRDGREEKGSREKDGREEKDSSRKKDGSREKNSREEKDGLRLTTRADFPHDSWWTRATVAFSDGTAETVELGKRADPQSFPIKRRGITWLKVGQLVKADDPYPFPALTQIEVFGRNSGGRQ